MKKIILGAVFILIFVGCQKQVKPEVSNQVVENTYLCIAKEQVGTYSKPFKISERQAKSNMAYIFEMQAKETTLLIQMTNNNPSGIVFDYPYRNEVCFTSKITPQSCTGASNERVFDIYASGSKTFTHQYYVSLDRKEVKSALTKRNSSKGKNDLTVTFYECRLK